MLPFLDIEQRLKKYSQREQVQLQTFSEHKQQAAVLLLLSQQQGQVHITFIRRTEHPNDPHSGQVAFPGGRVEASDQHYIATALREAQEEIGLPQNQVSIMGGLPAVMSINAYRVVPIVGYTQDLQVSHLQRQVSEVERIFTIPLAWLADSKNRVTAEQAGYQKLVTKRPDRKIIFYELYDNERLWGLTAHIVQLFLQALQINK